MLAGGGVLRQGPLARCEAPDAGACSQCARPGAAEVACASGAHPAATRERIPAHRTRRGEALAAGIEARRADERREPICAAPTGRHDMRPPSRRLRGSGTQMLSSPQSRTRYTRATRSAINTRPAHAGAVLRPHPPLVVEPTALGPSSPCYGAIVPKLCARCRPALESRSVQRLIAGLNTPLTVCRRDGTGVAKLDSDRDRWSTDCERPRPPREEVLDASKQRIATAGRRRAPCACAFAAIAEPCNDATARRRRLPQITLRRLQRSPCLDSSPTCR